MKTLGYAVFLLVLFYTVARLTMLVVEHSCFLINDGPKTEQPPAKTEQPPAKTNMPPEWTLETNGEQWRWVDDHGFTSNYPKPSRELAVESAWNVWSFFNTVEIEGEWVAAE